jgi:hypothetical protein
MSKQTVGTDSISGLNVALASHKIEDNELTVSENGWTDEEGVWRTMPGPTVLYTGYSNIVAMAAGRMGGSDHVVWLDGTTLYDNGVSKGTLATTDPVIRDFDDKFFIMGADDGKNYVYDGNHLREAGPWEPFSSAVKALMAVGITKAAASTVTITSITQDDPAVITESTGHTLVAGQPIYIEGVSTLTQVNGRSHLVTEVDTNEITIAFDSSLMSAGTGGTGHQLGSGLDGYYKWYATNIIKLKDNSVLESVPNGLGTVLAVWGTAHESLDAVAYDVSPTDSVKIQLEDYFDEYNITGTLGVDYFPGFRLYRTKNGGEDFYLEEEFYYGDDDVAGGAENLVVTYYSYKPDADLGAVYTPGTTDRSPQRQASLMASAAQRIWMNDLDEPYNLYYTSLDGTDYVPLLNFLRLPDDITAIGQAGDVVVVFSSDRMWRASLLGGLPDVDEIKTPVGTTYGNALALTDLGLLFLRDDGLWATDGASPPSKVSRRAFSTLTGPLAVAAYGDTLAVMGTDDMYVMRRRDGGSYWHGPAVAYTHLDATGGTFYASDANSIYTLFTGPRMAGAMETKDFWLGGEAEATRVVVDCSGSVSVGVMVEGNRDSDYDLHEDDGTDRRLVRYPIPRLVNHVARVRVEASGEAAVYGVWLEVNR